MAHKKAGGSVKNGRDSVGQRLGIKAGDGQAVQAGAIIVRQRGMTFLAGEGTDLGGDYTLFATTAGHVKFEHATKDKKRVRVIPAEPRQRSRHEARHPSQVPRGQGPLRLLRARVDGRLDARGAPRRRLRQLPPVLHGHAEHHRHGRPGRALPEAPGAAGPGLIRAART